MVVQWMELGLTDPNALECSNFFPACAFFFYIDELAKAAYYALTDEELEDILDTEEAALRLFLKGLIQAQCRLIKYVAPQAARDEFETLCSALQAGTELFRSIWG